MNQRTLVIVVVVVTATAMVAVIIVIWVIRRRRRLDSIALRIALSAIVVADRVALIAAGGLLRGAPREHVPARDVATEVADELDDRADELATGHIAAAMAVPVGDRHWRRYEHLQHGNQGKDTDVSHQAPRELRHITPPSQHG